MMTRRQMETKLRSMRGEIPPIDPERQVRDLQDILERIRADRAQRGVLPHSRSLDGATSWRPARAWSLPSVVLMIATITLLLGISAYGRSSLSGLVAPASPYDDQSDRELRIWSKTSVMPGPRAEHEMVLLSDGSVLAVGGQSMHVGTGPIRSAALFNPNNETWDEVTGPSVARYRFGSLIALPDRSALLAGGWSYKDNQVLASVERYMPDQGDWELTDSLHVPRADAALIALANGDILISGGIGQDGEPLDSSELYNLDTQQWRDAGVLPEPRASHELVLLPDGRVLAIGGMTSNAEATREIAVFDPNINTWSPAGRIMNRRQRTASVVLDNGVVLITGGTDGESGPSQIIWSSTESYDPSTATTIEGHRPMTFQRAGHKLHRLNDGRIMAIGGDIPARKGMTTEFFDPNANFWYGGDSTDLIVTGNSTVSLADGRILLTGGWSPDGRAVDLSGIFE